MERNAALALAVALVGACADPPSSPTAVARQSLSRDLLNQQGTGLVIDNLTNLSLPLIGSLGDVIVDQANITQLVLVEDVVGNIVGLQANGTLRLTGGVLGTDVITENFLTELHVASSGPGQCDVVTVDLGPIALDAIGETVAVDAPQVNVTPKASGALGPLLCGLGQALQPPVTALTGAVRGLVNAINRILI
ncbi:MAG: hypothetical protein ACRENU_12215 [Gemmatimonadaceae bacterium]